ncbi:scavenger receptor class F member 2 [Sminthopsis crassicaudata]|uniref:scavenger receptor class F member 2 n=1 Tax=Sminthopsis crassicaudata TaxID=9301 RepID=UPI003D6958BA
MGGPGARAGRAPRPRPPPPSPPALMLLPPLLLLLLLPLPPPLRAAPELSPRGRNVCRAPGSQALACCAGWRQQGEECTVALCEGNSTCSENEVCVRPGECRCRHGYFGATCDTKCPPQFWGPDCKELCSCHPHGQCEDVTGQCTCHAHRWGARCEHACLCQHGACHPQSGACRCEPGWWGAQCANACYCSQTSQCEPQTGACLCHTGWWGRSCNNQCSCNGSPCEQFSGRCQCRERTFGPRCERYCQCYRGRCNPLDGTCACEPGYRGKYCRETCPAGFYGPGCRRRCGQCKGQQPCTVAEGRCLTCEAGWNGTKCDQPCGPGFYGDGCELRCPPCRDGHTCNHITGKCTRCNAGWIGDRCESKCSNGTYGEDCAFVCSDCSSGRCDFQSGRCLCGAGAHGPHCNLTCLPGHHGVDCAQTCSCHEDTCDPVTGACHMETNQRQGVMGAGALLILLLGLLLSLLGCCCVCRSKDPSRQDCQPRRKKSSQRLCGRFSRISMKLPRIPLRRQKLPKVVVAHHDPENTLNCSFLEPPSVLDPPSPSWSSRASFSSFDTTDEGPVYCVPHEESAPENPEGEPSGPPAEVPGVPGPREGEDAGVGPSGAADSRETVLLASSDSERSASSPELPAAALYARVARLAKQPSAEAEGLSPSPERRKPPPPDPSTKPKVSWIHGRYGSQQSNSLPASSRAPDAGHGLSKRKRTPSETSSGLRGRGEEPGSPRGPDKGPKPPSVPEGRPGGESPLAQGLPRARERGPGGSEPADAGLQKPRAEGLPSRLSPEAAALLATQLKEKTGSLGRGEAGTQQNGLGAPQPHREKPAPPQKAKRSSLPGSRKAGASTSPAYHRPQAAGLEAKAASGDCLGSGAGKLDTGRPGSQEPSGLAEVPRKKTPIQKPPRKKSREAAGGEQGKAVPSPP